MEAAAQYLESQDFSLDIVTLIHFVGYLGNKGDRVIEYKEREANWHAQDILTLQARSCFNHHIGTFTFVESSQVSER